MYVFMCIDVIIVYSICKSVFIVYGKTFYILVNVFWSISYSVLSNLMSYDALSGVEYRNSMCVLKDTSMVRYIYLPESVIDSD